MYYQPYKKGAMNQSQAKIMQAVGEKANLRQIQQRSGYRSFQSVYLLVEQLIKQEILQAIEA